MYATIAIPLEPDMSDDIIARVAKGEFNVRSFETREEWLAARRDLGFGASESASLFGAGYESPASLVMRKAGVLPEREVDDETREKFDIATALEPSLLALYSARTGRNAAHQGLVTWARSDAPWMFATPDGFTDCGRVVQIKTAAQTPWDEERLPISYVVQVQHEMACTGASVADLAVLFYGGGLAFRVYEVKADEEFAAILRAKTQGSWELVQRVRAGEHVALPEVSIDDGDLLARYVAQAPEKIHVFDERETAMAEVWLAEKANSSLYGKAAESLGNIEKAARYALLARMGDAGIGLLPDGRRLVAKAVRRDGYEVKPSSWVELALAKEKKA